jgi:hypothetical protein
MSSVSKVQQATTTSLTLMRMARARLGLNSALLLPVLALMLLSLAGLEEANSSYAYLAFAGSLFLGTAIWSALCTATAQMNRAWLAGTVPAQLPMLRCVFVTMGLMLFGLTFAIDPGFLQGTKSGATAWLLALVFFVIRITGGRRWASLMVALALPVSLPFAVLLVGAMIDGYMVGSGAAQSSDVVISWLDAYRTGLDVSAPLAPVLLALGLYLSVRRPNLADSRQTHRDMSGPATRLASAWRSLGQRLVMWLALRSFRAKRIGPTALAVLMLQPALHPARQLFWAPAFILAALGMRFFSSLPLPQDEMITTVGDLSVTAFIALTMLLSLQGVVAARRNWVLVRREWRMSKLLPQLPPQRDLPAAWRQVQLGSFLASWTLQTAMLIGALSQTNLRLMAWGLVAMGVTGLLGTALICHWTADDETRHWEAALPASFAVLISAALLQIEPEPSAALLIAAMPLLGTMGLAAWCYRGNSVK